MKKIITLTFVIMVLLGCSAEKQLARRIGKAKVLAVENPKDFAGIWANAYPVKEVYVKGKDNVVEKTLTVIGDSIPCPKNRFGIVEKAKCPDIKYLEKVVMRIDTMKIENKARSAAIQLEYDALIVLQTQTKSDLAEATEKAKSRFWWVVGMGCFIIASTFFPLLAKSRKII